MLNVLAMRRSILANALLEGFESGLRSTGVPREARMRLVAGSVGRLMAEGYFAGYARGAETGYEDGMMEGRREIIHSAAWIKFGPIAASRVTELFERTFKPEWTAQLAGGVVNCGTATEFRALLQELTQGERT